MSKQDVGANEDKHRQTGRTTRMMEEAKASARAGRAVYVIVSHLAYVRFFEDEETIQLGIKFETPTSMSNFDWPTMSPKGAHPNCVVLVDHYAIESYFSRMLAVLHRYDKEKPNAE